MMLIHGSCIIHNTPPMHRWHIVVVSVVCRKQCALASSILMLGVRFHSTPMDYYFIAQQVLQCAYFILCIFFFSSSLHFFDACSMLIPHTIYWRTKNCVSVGCILNMIFFYIFFWYAPLACTLRMHKLYKHTLMHIMCNVFEWSDIYGGSIILF